MMLHTLHLILFFFFFSSRRRHTRLQGDWSSDVCSSDLDSETIEAKNVVIATGSKARHLPGVAVDNKIICDNEGALAFDSVPERLGVIGAGVIGLELGSVWRRPGAEVEVLEAPAAFPRAADAAVGHETRKAVI